MEDYNKEEKNYYGEDGGEEARDNFESGSKPRKSLDTNQKIALFGLGVLMIVVLIFWSSQFKKNLAINVGENSRQANELCPNGNCSDANNSDSLKLKDTDKDGLSDWDELYLHKTSPYLLDSDGDGTSDYEELMREQDPNCPAGSICAGEESVDQPAEPEDILIAPGKIGENKNSDQLNQKDLNDIMSGKTEADQVRQMLLEYGMDKALLDQISDVDLLETYNQTLKDLNQAD